MKSSTRFLIILFTVCCSSDITNAGKWVGSSPTAKGPSCFSSFGRMRLEESRQIPGQCLELKCMANEAVNMNGCTPPNTLTTKCHIIPGNMSLPFPHCCNNYMCPVINIDN